MLTSHDKQTLIKWAIESNFSPEKMIIRFISYEEIPTDYFRVNAKVIAAIENSLTTEKSIFSNLRSKGMQTTSFTLRR